MVPSRPTNRYYYPGASHAQMARDRGAARLYWHTRQGNERARLLYGKVADFHGFVTYDRRLD